jgi:virulence factor Mce-like protein
MRRSSIFANPVLVGAVTVLVVTVAVFLSYNANNGLPFVPTQALKVRVSNGANLVKGNEVRSGGFRVGVVSDMRPVRLEDGEVGAELTLKLDKSIGEVPKDSRFVIRPRSALGLKYLELTEGSSDESFVDGDTVPAEQAHVPVDLDEFYEMFDKETREGSQAALRGFGDGFTGRGQALGRTVEELPRLLDPLETVMRNLASEDTELVNFFKELADAARIVAPVSGVQAQLFTDMADTFEAFGRDEEALKSFIEKSPPTLDVSIDSLKVQRPFLSHFADFSEDFQPATRELRAALPVLNSAIARGIPVQRRAVELNEELADTMSALEELATAPGTNPAIRALTATVDTLNPQLRYYGPTITVCNAWSYFWTYLAEHFSEPDTTGSAQRALLNSAGRQEDSFSEQEANAPANGRSVQEGNAQYLKGQDFPHSVTDDGKADCESGQRGWLERQASQWPRQLGGANLRIARDPVTPGVQGPTYAGRAEVYPGQTFTRNPQTGPYAAGLNRESEFGGR